MKKKKKVLIVDDDPDILASASAVLEDNGYETLTAIDGEEGLARAGEAGPDLILLDLLMPRKSGIKFMDEIKQDEALKDVPIVVVSGARQVTGVDMKHYLERRPYKERKRAVFGPEADDNVNAYLEKGARPSELLETVRKWI